MNSKEATKTLKEAERLKRNTHTILHSFWFPLVFWGIITLFSGLSVAMAGIESLSIFWPVAGTGGFVVMAVYYARREKVSGVKGLAWPYIVLALALMVGAALVSNFGSAYTKEVGSWLVVSIAYLGFARLARSWFLASLAIVLGLLAVIVGLREGDSYIFLSLVYGLSFIIAGIFARKVEMSHA